MTAELPRELEADRLARVTLNLLVEPGDPGIADLVDELGAETVVTVLESDRSGRLFSTDVTRRLEHVDPAGVLERAAERGIRYVTPADPEWPRQLGSLGACTPLQERGGVPLGLWVKGALDLREATTGRAIAVAGSRAATAYGLGQANEISADLADQNRTIVSGGGVGIGRAALRGALTRGGTTVAVLASGVDRPYPTAHTALLENIANRGLVVSEAAPGAAPTRTRFLARNRIIAGLSEGVVVVEAAHRSGALNQARWAAELDRPILAVPGPTSSIVSAGTNQLLRTGEARLVAHATDIVNDLAGETSWKSARQPWSSGAPTHTHRATSDHAPATGPAGVGPQPRGAAAERQRPPALGQHAAGRGLGGPTR